MKMKKKKKPFKITKALSNLPTEALSFANPNIFSAFSIIAVSEGVLGGREEEGEGGGGGEEGEEEGMGSTGGSMVV